MIIEHAGAITLHLPGAPFNPTLVAGRSNARGLATVETLLSNICWFWHHNYEQQTNVITLRGPPDP